MFILSIIFVELLIILAIVGQMYYLHREIDCTYNQISIGMNPKLYTKNYKGVDFKFSLLPFQVLDYDFEHFSLSKWQKTNRFILSTVAFICIAVPHSLLLFSFCDGNFWYIFYKTLITSQISDAEIVHLNYHLGRLSVQPIKLFIIVVFSSATVYVWYISLVRSVLNSILNLISTKFNITFNSTLKYIIPSIIILYLYLRGSVYRLLFILVYDSMGGVFSWLIAHCILMVILAAVIEILSRISKNVPHSTL